MFSGNSLYLTAKVEYCVAKINTQVRKLCKFSFLLTYIVQKFKTNIKGY